MRRTVLVAALVFATAGGVFAQTGNDEATRLAQSLIGLRGEVEQLNGELETLRTEQRTTLQGLAAQKAELAAQLERQQVQLSELEARHAERNAAAARATNQSAGLSPVLLESIAQLRRYVAGALPFKTAERLASLDEIRVLIENGTLPPTRAANRLWAWVEDEIRLTRETGLYQQTVTLGSEQVLAHVAKVGSMMLFYRTEDGRVGGAVRAASGWRFAAIEDDANRTRVLALFDSLDKQIRQGYFELPFVIAAAADR